MNLLLTNIQRFCTSDGPGIRTTLFAKGCTIRCPWCANPENLTSSKECYITEKCEADRHACSLRTSCRVAAGNSAAGMHMQDCPVGGIGVYGKEWHIDEAAKMCLKDLEFYGTQGGITASGGEALMQAEEFAGLFDRMHHRHVSCCVETALFINKRNVEQILPYTDYWYIDLKLLNAQKAMEVLGGNLEQYLDNLDYVFQRCPASRICIRIPLVKYITCTRENLEQCARLLCKYKPEKCEIFSVHNLGERKYRSLGRTYQNFEVLDEKMLVSAQEILAKSTVPVFINKI